MFLPDKFIREPALLIPGRKPRGRVVVDWSHPLSKGLVHCIVGPYDTADRERADFLGNTSYSAGDFIGNGGNDDHVTFGASPIHDTELTVAVLYKPNVVSVNTDNVIFGNAQYISSDDSDGWAIRQSNAKIELNVGSTAAGWNYAVFNNVLIAGDWFLLVGVFYSDPGFRPLFVNGKRLSPDGAAGNGMPSQFSVPVGLLGNTGTGYFGSKAGLTGEIKFAYAWDRAFSDSEAFALSRDPYQFLKPAGGAW